ncbi:MAG: aspartyl protease family protein [Planctomycetes bacterium]|nr:aspartyl protease family protein [Planctomycetota bacterium]MCW8135184.1 aspartyl protease family protein [Planctomycetota bacterium]
MKLWITRLFALSLAIGLLASAATLAQDAPKPADPEKKTEAKDIATSTVDFEFEGLMFVQTKVNGKGPYKFLFDSGATQSVLNERLAKELGLELHDMPGGVQGVGTADAKLVVLDSMEIGGFKRGECIAASMNLDHMSGTLGYHMMGIIGQNVIKRMQKVEIDFSAGKLAMTRYPAGEEPSDMQEDMLIRMLKGGGGMPGMPGMPGRRQPPPDEKKPDKKDDEFSLEPVLPNAAWLLQDERRTESKPDRRSPTEGMTLTYRTGELEFFGRKMELVPYWYLDCVINGKTKSFMFDTGASMLLALGTKLAEDVKIPTSFTYPVKGIGKGDAKSGLVDSFQVGVIKEVDAPCTIMELPKITDQLGQMGAMIPGVDKLNFDGIVGITLATRFKKMIVDAKNRHIEFIPYGKDEVNKLEPSHSEEFVRDAVIRTWQGKAGTFSLTGDSVQLENWKAKGLESGGLEIESVVEGGAAHKAGLKKGDIITHLVGAADDLPEDMEDADVDGKDVKVRDMPALIMWACSKDPGTEVSVRIKRGDEVKDLKLKLDDYGFKGSVPDRFKK